MQLDKAVPKVQTEGTHRATTIEETWNRVTPYLFNAGITRVADITGLDRVGIPVFNAIAPYSNDHISVYSGKGITKRHARVSAVMEAFERHAAALPRTPDAVCSYNQARKRYENVLNPIDINLSINPMYNDELPLSWCWFFDIGVNPPAPTLVPHAITGYLQYSHEMPVFAVSSTNGIASGNTLEEAACHAIYELIERDDWTAADIVSNRISRSVSEGRIGSGSIELGDLLGEKNPSLDMSSVPKEVQTLLGPFFDANIEVEMKDISGPSGVTTIIAVSHEVMGENYSRLHQGFGCSCDPLLACTRALTEVAQSRVVDIQATREDISQPQEDVPRWMRHSQRAAAFRSDGWLMRKTKLKRSFKDLQGFQSFDFTQELKMLQACLNNMGLKRILLRDLTAPSFPMSVVRVVVPGIESWGIDHSKLGTRGANCWRGTMRDLKRLGYFD